MAIPVIVGVGAIAAALVGRHLVRNGIIGKRAADQWVKGGFKAKMDRKEAIAILGLKDSVTLLMVPSTLYFYPIYISIIMNIITGPFSPDPLYYLPSDSAS
ncbi:hypothetical protein EV702DRAFT_1275824 [Suillus placidus]|uniref:Uncharacterized protein n=1 Tax=Suillus placidus TaxID=48579 RepID=A0A9P7D631_9AGAM|nr:hypothetical protein EV702DRAFT_1275824 [Suillus placidus]